MWVWEVDVGSGVVMLLYKINTLRAKSLIEAGANVNHTMKVVQIKHHHLVM